MVSTSKGNWMIPDTIIKQEDQGALPLIRVRITTHKTTSAVCNCIRLKIVHSVKYCTVRYRTEWAVLGLWITENTLSLHCLWTVFIALLHFNYMTLSNKLTLSIRPKTNNIAFGYLIKLNIEKSPAYGIFVSYLIRCRQGHSLRLINFLNETSYWQEILFKLNTARK